MLNLVAKSAGRSFVVLFDYGGVIARSHIEVQEERLAAKLDVDVVMCRQLLSERSQEGRAFREDRLTEVQFWQAICGRVGREFDPSEVDELSRLWAETYELDLDVLAVVRELEPSAFIGILTNIDRARSRYLIDVVKIVAQFDLYLPSYRCSATKPSIELWRCADAEVSSALGARLPIVYVDDREGHVSAASAFGWHGIVFRGADDLRSQLKEMRRMLSGVG